MPADRLGPYGYGAPEHLDFDIDDDDIYDEEVDSAIAEEHHIHENGLSQLDNDLDTHHPEFDSVSSSISSGAPFVLHMMTSVLPSQLSSPSIKPAWAFENMTAGTHAADPVYSVCESLLPYV